jgi:transcription-repair coupling factor (superfamily II helicase)
VRRRRLRQDRGRRPAAFAVALNGKQTLMLVPTTVLAQQHWNTFRERYRDFPFASRWFPDFDHRLT